MRRISAVWAWAAFLLLAVGNQPADAAGELVLVAGASGRTGQLIVRELVANGYRVRALVRDADRATSAPGEDGIEYAVGDVRQRATLDSAMRGVRYVISAIGAVPKEKGNSPEFVDYGGVRNLAESAAAAKVEQLVVISSAGVTQKDHVLNRMFDNVLIWKGKGEDAVRSSGVPYTIVRPGGLTDKPGGQSGLRLEQGDKGTGMIPRGDLARVCVAALKSEAARNRTFEVYGADTPPEIDWDSLFGKLAADPSQP